MQEASNTKDILNIDVSVSIGKSHKNRNSNDIIRIKHDKTRNPNMNSWRFYTAPGLLE